MSMFFCVAATFVLCVCVFVDFILVFAHDDTSCIMRFMLSEQFAKSVILLNYVMV